MTVPYVELGFNPTDLRPGDLPRAGAFLGSPAEALEASLSVIRARMVDQMKSEVRGIAEPTHAQVVQIANLAWQAVFWQFRKVSAPVIADAYIRAYRAAEAGDVPMSVVYALADKHADKVGDYFHTSSAEALGQGFTKMVNRRLPARAAAIKAMEGYGLTPRQMSGYVATAAPEPVATAVPLALKSKLRAYIDKSFTGRIKKLASQEEHNIDQQAQQFAWMWLQEKGRLSKKAEKLWITAKDERVCNVCGPLHNQRVKVNERFTTSQGEFWTPGLHPNCRCVVRLLEHRFSKASTAVAEWDPREHPRGGDPANKGRFSRLPATLDIEDEIARSQVHLDPKAAQKLKHDPKLAEQFFSLIRANMHQKVQARPEATAQPKVIGAVAEPQVAPPQVRAPAVTAPKVVAPKVIAPAVAPTKAPAKAPVVTPPVTKTPPVTRTQAKPKPKTQVSGVTQPLGKTVFAVLDPYQIKGGNLDEAREMNFSSDKEAAIMHAEQQIKWQVEDVVEYYESVRGARVAWDAPAGDQSHILQTKLTPEQIKGVVEWRARQAGYRQYNMFENPRPEMVVKPHTVMVEAETIGGESVGEVPLSYNTIARSLGIHHKQFQISVVEVERGHIDHINHEHYGEAGDEWFLEGPFEARGAERTTHGREYGVNVIRMDPKRESTGEGS